MYHRRRRYNRRFRRGNVHSNFRYTGLSYYTHRYANAFGLVSSSGFYDHIESIDPATCTGNEVINSKTCHNGHLQAYLNDTEEFKAFFPDMLAPQGQASTLAPYFALSKELRVLVTRYSKYKLVSVKHYMSNFKFLNIVIRAKSSKVTQDDRLKCQQYFIQRYGGGGNIDFKNYVVDYDKFDVTYQWVPTLSIEKVYRNHTCVSDPNLQKGDVEYSAGDPPVIRKALYNKTVLREVYYPKAKCYLESNNFFSNKFENGNFKKWLDAMQVTNYPNLTYARICPGPEQYIHADANTCTLHAMIYNCNTYYRFKFSGMNNLSIE